MQYPVTVVIRHKKENLKKCSLSGLEKREDFIFLSYPFNTLPPLENYLLLALDGEKELSIEDSKKGLLLLDSTWRYLTKMRQAVDAHISLEKRTLPANFKTAYPRTQEDCVDPARGLSSLEALYVSYQILGRSTAGLLDSYYWKERFLLLND